MDVVQTDIEDSYVKGLQVLCAVDELMTESYDGRASFQTSILSDERCRPSESCWHASRASDFSRTAGISQGETYIPYGI